MGFDDKVKFRESFIKLHHRDRARYLFTLDQKTRKHYYTYLTPREIARLLESVKAKERIQYILELPVETASHVLTEMYVDNAVDTPPRQCRLPNQ